MGRLRWEVKVELNVTWVLFCFPESIIAETQKKITDAFEVFDHECNKTVDVRSGIPFFKKCYIDLCSDTITISNSSF